MTDARDAGLDAVLIGGREQRAIVIVEYDEAWPAKFDELAERIRSALGPAALGIEHIGSTAVPGLAAKPIIDMLLVVSDVEDEAAYVPRLEEAGLVLRVREPGHRMFRTPELDYHVHVLSPDSAERDAYIALRDWLRVDASDRELYATTKKALASRTWTDMNYYADAKSDVVQAILQRARERRSTSER